MKIWNSLRNIVVIILFFQVCQAQAALMKVTYKKKDYWISLESKRLPFSKINSSYKQYCQQKNAEKGVKFKLLDKYGLFSHIFIKLRAGNPFTGLNNSFTDLNNNSLDGTPAILIENHKGKNYYHTSKKGERAKRVIPEDIKGEVFFPVCYSEQAPIAQQKAVIDGHHKNYDKGVYGDNETNFGIGALHIGQTVDVEKYLNNAKQRYTTTAIYFLKPVEDVQYIVKNRTNSLLHKNPDYNKFISKLKEGDKETINNFATKSQRQIRKFNQPKIFNVSNAAKKFDNYQIMLDIDNKIIALRATKHYVKKPGTKTINNAIIKRYGSPKKQFYNSNVLLYGSVLKYLNQGYYLARIINTGVEYWFNEEISGGYFYINFTDDSVDYIVVENFNKLGNTYKRNIEHNIKFILTLLKSEVENSQKKADQFSL